MNQHPSAEASSVKQTKNRNVDVNKQLFIIRDSRDVSKYLGDDAEFQADAHEFLKTFEKNLAATISENDRNKSILVPQSGNVEGISTVPDSTQKLRPPDPSDPKIFLPRHYIRHKVHKDQGMGMIMNEKPLGYFDPLVEDYEFVKKLNSMMYVRPKLLSHKKPFSKNCRGSNDGYGVLQMSDFSKIIDRLESKTGMNEKEICFDVALKCVNDLHIGVMAHVTREIYYYWLRRRRAFGHALCREFWSPSQSNDSSPFAIFRHRNRDRMILRKPRKTSWEVLSKIDKIFLDFKKVDRIMRKTREHDIDRLQLADLKSILFEQRRHEICDETYSTPQWTAKKPRIASTPPYTSAPCKQELTATIPMDQAKTRDSTQPNLKPNAIRLNADNASEQLSNCWPPFYNVLHQKALSQPSERDGKGDLVEDSNLNSDIDGDSEYSNNNTKSEEDPNILKLKNRQSPVTPFLRELLRGVRLFIRRGRHNQVWVDRVLCPVENADPACSSLVSGTTAKSNGETDGNTLALQKHTFNFSPGFDTIARDQIINTAGNSTFALNVLINKQIEYLHLLEASQAPDNNMT